MFQVKPSIRCYKKKVFSSIPKRIPYILKKNRAIRLDLQKKIFKINNLLKRVIWSDETKFILFYGDGIHWA